MVDRLQLATTFTHDEVKAVMQAWRIMQRTPETVDVCMSKPWQSLVAKFRRLDAKANGRPT